MTAARQVIHSLLNKIVIFLRILICVLLFGLLFMHTSESHSYAGSMYSSAKSYMGLHERKNAGTLRRAIGVNPARVPWCGYFVAKAAKRSGYKPPAGAGRAYSWTKFGRKVSRSGARKGDVVVIRTRRGHHVTIYAGSAGKGRFKGLGGNQSNRVRVSTYSTRSIVAVRRAGGAKRTYASRPISTKSFKSRSVRKVSFKKTGLGKFLRKLRERS